MRSGHLTTQRTPFWTHLKIFFPMRSSDLIFLTYKQTALFLIYPFVECGGLPPLAAVKALEREHQVRCSVLTA